MQEAKKGLSKSLCNWRSICFFLFCCFKGLGWKGKGLTVMKTISGTFWSLCTQSKDNCEYGKRTRSSTLSNIDEVKTESIRSHWWINTHISFCSLGWKQHLSGYLFMLWVLGKDQKLVRTPPYIKAGQKGGGVFYFLIEGWIILSELIC